jgi:hypothetical protein
VKTDFKTLTKLKVNLSGDWDSMPRRVWEGVARCSEALVGISFLSVGDHTEWCKFYSDSPDGLEFHVGLFTMDKDPKDVGITFNGLRWRTTVESEHDLPAILAPSTVQTGEIVLVSKVGLAPVIPASVLFLVRRDVKMGRNHLWHLRKELLDGISEPFAKILTYGRAGKLDFAI